MYVKVMDLSLILLSILLLIGYLGYKYLYAPLQLFRSIGIKGPPPLPVLGNFHLRYKLGFFKFYNSLNKNYGSVVGFYNPGGMPVLAVTDVDMLKHILVKEFDAFMDRPYIPQLTREATAPRGILTSQGQEWKTARQTLSPSFSAAKMKAMVPLIEKSANTLVEVFGQSANPTESVDVCRFFGRFTMETILATAFGRSVDVQRGESDQIVEAASYIFNKTCEGNSLSLALLPLLYSLPWLEGFVRLAVSQTTLVGHSKTIYSLFKEVLNERRQNPNPRKYKDLLQLMIDANTKAEEDTEKRLTNNQIVAHSITFLMAGYDTTMNTLSYVSYLLAVNPEVQERLQNEIDSYFKKNPDSSLYDAVQEIEYLDKVVCESLRLYSPAGNIIRYCRKSVVINGVKIPEGVTIDVPIHVLHKNPKHWKNPDEFDPERFSPEEKAKRPQLSYIPFGFGPRRCIGMRFAILEAKMALIQLLKKFTFVQTTDTQVPLQTSFGLSISPKNGVYLRITTRNN